MSQRYKQSRNRRTASPQAFCAAVAGVFLLLKGCGGGAGSDDPMVPDLAYCDAVADWTDIWVDMESEVLVLVNQERDQGADCGPEGIFGPAEPLVIDPALTCAARVHSMDMADRGFFDHTNPDGQTPFDRMLEAGYDFAAAGENIARGQSSPEQVMASWMASSGHCANIMNPGYQDIGIGYYDGAYWTQVFGTH